MSYEQLFNSKTEGENSAEIEAMAFICFSID